MEIPNYDFNEEENTNFKQLYNFTPKSNFRMLICDPPQEFDAKGESTLTTRLACRRSRICAY